MRILIIGKSNDALTMTMQSVESGHLVGLAPNELLAARWLADDVFDLVLLIPSDNLAETEQTAAAFKRSALAESGEQKPCVFLVCGTKEEFERASGDKRGMPSVDVVLQVFSVEKCEHVYECLRSGGALPW